MSLKEKVYKKVKQLRVKKNQGIDKKGKELVDSKPLAAKLGFKKEKSLQEKIRDMVRNERLMQDLDRVGMETFEDADDFNIGDDFDLHSPYENEFDPDFDRSDFNGFIEEKPAEQPKKASEVQNKAPSEPKKGETNE
jgi:hypothetical protein